jgi:hypothetical protein
MRPLLLLAVALSGCPAPMTEPDAGASLLDAGDAVDAGITVDAGEPVAFDGGAFLVPELLGRPEPTSIALNLVPARDLDVFVEAGDSAMTLQTVVPMQRVTGGVPVVLTLSRLQPDRLFSWRLSWRVVGATAFTVGPLRTFRTARPPGRGFTFTIQADSHMDENSVPDQYVRTLSNVRTDAPDFHVDLGDTFMCEKHDQPLVAPMVPAPDEPTVVTRYLYERRNFGVLSPSVPLFLVNGNHDGELGYLSLGAGNDLATWATRARQQYFLPPTPDTFFSGDERTTAFLGRRGAFYAFTWGDALFVMLDPFWDTVSRSNMNGWTMTLGASQYTWLAQTLRSSTAKWKFVFIHNLVGGLDGQQRGGIEAAPYFEWGGLELDGGFAFPQRRPAMAGWQKPIHALLVETGVTAVFHGHDHLYVHQSLDGVVYQEVPQPSARNTNNAAVLAGQYHYDAGTSLASAGHLRITVTPTTVTSEYVRSWLPMQETASRHNAEVAHTWSISK